MYDDTVRPAIHPMIGIMNWNSPKWNDKPERMPMRHLRQRQPGRHGHRQGVHRQTHRNAQ